MINNAKINYTGLRKRPQFEQIVDYLANKQEKTKYPNREAKQIRNHPYLTQLDGIGMFEMQEQQENAWKEQEKERIVKQLGITGKRDASAQVQTVTNEDWDRMMEEAGGMIQETHEEMKRDRNTVEVKNQTRAPWALQTGSQNMIEDAMNRNEMFSLRSIRLSMPSSSKGPASPEVFIIEQMSNNKGPPPPPGAAGAMVLSDKRSQSLGRKALRAGFNAVYYGGKGSYYFLKFIHENTKPVVIGIAEFLTSVDYGSGLHLQDEGYANEDDDDEIEPPDDPVVPSSVLPPRMSSGPKGKQEPFALSKKSAGPGVRAKARELARGVGRAYAMLSDIH